MFSVNSGRPWGIIGDWWLGIGVEFRFLRAARIRRIGVVEEIAGWVGILSMIF